MLKVCQKARFPSPLFSTIGNNWKFIEKYLYKNICISFYMHICKTFTATCVPCVPLAALHTRAILSKNAWIMYTLICLYLSQFFLQPQKNVDVIFYLIHLQSICSCALDRIYIENMKIITNTGQVCWNFPNGKFKTLLTWIL